MRTIGMLVGLWVLNCRGAAPSPSVDASGSADPEVPAIHVGLTGSHGTVILAEGVFSERATVSIGSDATSTLSVPAEYGLRSRTIIQDGALVFTSQDVLATYQGGVATIEANATSPKPIAGGRYILHVGDVHVLVDSVRARASTLKVP